VTVDTKTNVPVQPQPFPSAKYVTVSANQTLDFEAICALTTDLPDSTVHRRRRLVVDIDGQLQASKQANPGLCAGKNPGFPGLTKIPDNN